MLNLESYLHKNKNVREIDSCKFYNSFNTIGYSIHMYLQYDELYAYGVRK